MAFDSELHSRPDTFGRAKGFVASYVVRTNTLNLSRSVRSVELQAPCLAPSASASRVRSLSQRAFGLSPSRLGRSVTGKRVRLSLALTLNGVSRDVATQNVCSGSARAACR
jgi:hypothetical protein